MADSAPGGGLEAPRAAAAAEPAASAPTTAQTAATAIASMFPRRRLRVAFLTLLGFGAVALAYHLSDALNPFLLSLLIAYILHPALRFLSQRVGIPRGAAVA